MLSYFSSTVPYIFFDILTYDLWPLAKEKYYKNDLVGQEPMQYRLLHKVL